MRVIEVMKSFGLSDYEARALATLISKGVLSAREIAELSGIPRTSVYDVMNNLKAKGFVEEFGKPVKFKAVSKDEIILMISKKTAENLELLREELSKLREEEVEIVKLYRGKTVLEKLEEFVLSSKKEIVALISFIKPELKEILSKANCKLIIISENADELKGETYKLEFKGEKVVKDVSHGLFVFDDSKFFAIFMNHVSIGISGESEGMVQFSKLMIEPLLRDLRERKISPFS
ncbi:MAG: helix-turn-helix domain-containing protein [Archaeoglobaceae archaeon]|nr:helix-turn-helix domain-containing protein [Archaeoglobaceae archaeon]MDW8118152.1 helix-turn-helix domain-containing protein [Archaeoglobaceae archaeon]